ncbi:MAG: hypothetical protein JWQ59_2485 [Cryobacterium sp.]|nr:hypothetical protein [Cryobacterium sp.]
MRNGKHASFSMAEDSSGWHATGMIKVKKNPNPLPPNSDFACLLLMGFIF